jgi:hypothetical protein
MYIVTSSVPAADRDDEAREHGLERPVARSARITRTAARSMAV